MADELRLLAEQLQPTEKRDVYGSGSLINNFEEEVAELLGKPAALFYQPVLWHSLWLCACMPMSASATAWHCTQPRI